MICLSLPEHFAELSIDRRSQLYLSDTISNSASGEEDFDEDERGSLYDEESQIGANASSDENGRGVHIDTSFTGEWDDDDYNDLTPGPSANPLHPEYLFPVPEEGVATPRAAPAPAPQDAAHEHTPLLRKTTSLSFLERTAPPRAAKVVLKLPNEGASPTTIARRNSQLSTRSRVSGRRLSTGKAAKLAPTGQSTFGQTVSASDMMSFQRNMLICCCCWISCSIVSPFYSALACCPSPLHLPMRDGLEVLALSCSMVPSHAIRKCVFVSL